MSNKIEKATERAWLAVSEVVDDQDLSPQDALEVLEGLEGEIDIMKQALREDIRAEDE